MTENSLMNSEKLYFSISEIADSFGVSTSLIRYWETEFSFLNHIKIVKATADLPSKTLSNCS